MEILFWLAAAFLFYVYFGYAVVLAAWARLRPARSTAVPGAIASNALPGVSIIVATRNESGRLARRIANLVALDYPSDRRQIIVVSDGSTDDTADVVAAFGEAAELLSVPAGGKALALNAGVARARHDVLVFADARQTFSMNALRALVAPLSDPRVGGVTGELRLGCESGGRRTGEERRTRLCADLTAVAHDRRVGPRRRDLTSTVADGVGLYWRYEKQLRRLESAVNSTLGATGAIYSLRRSLWRPLPAGTILDDVLAPMRAVLAGSRIVFEEAAQAFDGTSYDSKEEGHRKTRTLAGNFQIFALEPRLLLPVVNPVWLQYMSHKVGRLLAPYAIVLLFAANTALANAHPFFAVTLMAQVLFYLLAGYGAWLERTSEAEPRIASARTSATVTASREVVGV